MSRIENNSETIGNTPLIRLNRITAGLTATIVLKGEFRNPLGSVKDRIGLTMIEDAEAKGLITPGRTRIIEPTSGNTGNVLAFDAAAKGYEFTLTVPENMGLECRTLLAQLGAKLVLTPAADGMKGAISHAKELLDATRRPPRKRRQADCHHRLQHGRALSQHGAG